MSFFHKKMSQNVWATNMPFGPVTLMFYWPKFFFPALVTGTLCICIAGTLYMCITGILCICITGTLYICITGTLYICITGTLYI
jgi:hypothetical protein